MDNETRADAAEILPVLPAGRWPDRPVLEAEALCGVLLVYLGWLALLNGESIHVSPPWTALMPNLWLISSAFLGMRLFRKDFGFWTACGKRAVFWGLAATLLVLLVLAAALYRRRGGNVLEWLTLPDSMEGWMMISLVPLAEESYFRGWLLGHLNRLAGPLAAVLLSAVLFGFLHADQGIFWLTASLSLVLGLVVLKTRSLGWAVLLHALWNLASIHG